MDYNNDDNEHWGADDFYLQKDPDLDISNYLVDGVNQNEDDIFDMFDDATPTKASEDLPYSASSDNRRNMNKLVDEYTEPFTQLKRRRMLQFDTHVNDLCLSDEHIQSAFVKSKDREESMQEVIPEKLKWVSGCSENRPVCGTGRLDQSSDMWLSDCYNDDRMPMSSENVNVSAAADDQITVSDFCNIPTEMQADLVQQCATPPPQRIIFKGRKSYMQTPPSKIASSVAYPFALIKPCGVHGDVTLKDINKRILTPPSKSNDNNEASPPYPTSAFSGKPVVVKTKIRTEGGKGSITIMRTKG